MPEDKKDEIDQVLEGDGEEDHGPPPDDIMPLFFTSKTQEIFACRADEDVTEENPHKLISKEEIEQDFKNRAAISDFHPAKKIIQVCSRSNFISCHLHLQICKLSMFLGLPS